MFKFIFVSEDKCPGNKKKAEPRPAKPGGPHEPSPGETRTSFRGPKSSLPDPS